MITLLYMKKLLKKVLKVILKVLVILIIVSIVGDFIIFEILLPTSYTDEELRIICNSHDYDKLGKDALFVCMRVW